MIKKILIIMIPIGLVTVGYYSWKWYTHGIGNAPEKNWQAHLLQTYNSSDKENKFSSLLNKYGIDFADKDFTAMDCAPDGSKLVTGDAKGNLVIWDANDLKPTAVLESVQKNSVYDYFHFNSIHNILFDPANPACFLAFDGHAIRVFNLTLGGGFIRQVSMYGQCLDLNNEHVLAVGNGCTTSLYAFDYSKVYEDERLLGTGTSKIGLLPNMQAVALSPNDTLLASSSSCQGLKLTDLAEAKRHPEKDYFDDSTHLDGEPYSTALYSASEAKIYSLVFSKDSHLLAGVDILNKQVFVLSGPKWGLSSAFRLNNNSEITENCHLSISDDNSLLSLTLGTDEGYVFDLKSQRVVNIFSSSKAFVTVHFMPNSSQFVTLDNSGIPEIWDTTNVIGKGLESLDMSLTVSASLKWQPLILPITVEISTDDGLKVYWNAEQGWVTPIGKFTGELKINAEIETKIQAAVKNRDLVVIFENKDTGEEDCYAVHNGESIEAAFSGNTKVVVKNGIIHMIVSGPKVTVRFSRD